MRFKKVIALLVAMLMATTALAACGSGTEEETGTPSAPAETDSGATTTPDDSGDDDDDDVGTTVDAPVAGGLTLTVLTHRTDRDQDGSLAERTKAFEELYDCNVVYQSYTGYAEDALTMLSATNWGDVMMIPGVELRDLGEYYEPLGTYADLSQEYNWVQERMYDGLVYGMPHAGNVAGGYNYNKRIWEGAGITSMPTTPDEFVAALETIKEVYPDVIPLYTNYAAGWTMAGWTAFAYSAMANPDWQVDMLINSEDPFAPGSALYLSAKLQYDVFSNPDLIEADPSTTDWEACKALINEGKIATINLASWATSQFQEAGPNPEDIAFAPVPFTVDGKQWAESSGDYHLGVNKYATDEQKDLAKAYVFWFVNESGFAESEGMLSPRKGVPVEIPNFENVELFSQAPAPDGLVGVWDSIDKGSDVNINEAATVGNYKLRIAEAAFAGQPYSVVEDILTEMNEKWATERDANAELEAYLN